MNSGGGLRRRIQNEDVGGRKSGGLNEPLLGQRSSDDDDDDDRETAKRADQAWTYNVARLLAHWAQWFSTAVLAGGFRVGSNLLMAVLGRQLTEKPEVDLSPVVVARLKKLQERLAIHFDGSLPLHQEALKALWQVSFPERVMPGLVSPQWKDMGWQGNDPSTDFRGGGFISLENLLFFARRFPVVFQKLLHKAEGQRAEWEYPFAVAGLNITFMLIQLLDLRAAKPSSPSAVFNMLAADENAFDLLYCVAFQMLDAQWLAQGASYMEFNTVLGATRKQLERELVLEDIDRVEDLPSYISLDLLERTSYPAAASTLYSAFGEGHIPLQFVIEVSADNQRLVMIAGAWRRSGYPLAKCLHTMHNYGNKKQQQRQLCCLGKCRSCIVCFLRTASCSFLELAFLIFFLHSRS